MATVLGDRYLLHEPIGSGASGTVYRARDLRLHRDVAVKRLREDAMGGSESRERFMREASALALVSDPNVLAVFDVSSDPVDVYLVTGYCPEGSLADRLRRRPLTTDEARELAYQAGSGLSALHAAGIIHRDVKPSNIFRLGNRWVIGDLGIARVDGDSALTQTGAVIGTPDYWAPETARAEKPTHAVDIYGLGCVLYESLAGSPLFVGESPLATGLLHVTAETPPLPSAVRESDPQLASLVTRMLAKDPASRPTAALIACETRPGATTRSHGTLPSSRATVAMPTRLAPTLIQPVAVRQQVQPRRRRALQAAALVSLVLVAALGALLLGRRGGARAALERTSPTRTTGTLTAGRQRPVAPPLVGRSLSAATAQATRRQLRLVVSGTTPSSEPPGTVTRQVPAAGLPVPTGNVVDVTLSSGPTTQLTTSSPATRPPAKRNKGKGRDNPNRGRGHQKKS